MRWMMSLSLSLAIACVVFVGCKKESPNLTRGKELLLVDEVAGALTEFKIAAKQDPENKSAKVMLLYAIAKKERTVSALLAGQTWMVQYLRDKKNNQLTSENEAKANKQSAKIRQGLYEKGLDTKDLGELAEILEGVAQYVFENGKDDAELDAAAFVLAKGGNAKGAQRLCDRLKAEKVEDLDEYLLEAGQAVRPCLEKVVENPEGLGRDKALLALLGIGIKARAAELFKANPGLRGFDERPLLIPTTRNMEGPTRESLAGTLTRAHTVDGAANWDDNAKLSLRALWTGDEEKQAFVLIEGFLPEQSASLVQLYSFEKGVLTPVPVRSGGKDVSLRSDRPVARFRSRPSGRIEIVRTMTAETEQPESGARVRLASVGMRVYVDRIQSMGSVKAVDPYGLVTVSLDTPERGEKELEVPATVLSEVRMRKVKRTMAQASTFKFVAGQGFEPDAEPVTLERVPPENADEFATDVVDPSMGD